MDELRNRQRIKKKFYSKATILILLFLAIFLVNPTWKIWRKHVDSQKKLLAAKKELAELRQKESELSAEVELLQSEAGREQEIRKKFSVTKEGEEVVFLVDRQGSTTTDEVEESRGFFDKLWSWFANLFS